MIPVEGAQEKGCFDRIGFVAVKQRREGGQVGQIFHRRRRRRHSEVGEAAPLLLRSSPRPTGNDYDERGVKNRQRTTNTRCFMVMVPPFGNNIAIKNVMRERSGEEQPRKNPAMEVTLVAVPS